MGKHVLKFALAITLSILITVGTFMLINAALTLSGLSEPVFSREVDAMLSLLCGMFAFTVLMYIFIDYAEFIAEEVCRK